MARPVVGRRVVDDEDLERLVCLRRERVQTAAKLLWPVARADDRGHEHGLARRVVHRAQAMLQPGLPDLAGQGPRDRRPDEVWRERTGVVRKLDPAEGRAFATNEQPDRLVPSSIRQAR